MAKVKEYVLQSGHLWPRTPSGNPVEIEIIGATGETNAGKTLLGLTIAPGKHPEGHPFAGQPRTAIIDLEKSAGTFGGLGAYRVDAPDELLKKYGEKYTPLQVYQWFTERISGFKPGQFDVIIADPLNDVESGLVQDVKANPSQHGYSSNQFSSSTALLMGAVKAHWKGVLLRLSTRCKCFYFTTHLRDEWSGGKPTGKREPKGKDSLLELTSLYLWLERKADEKGVVPEAPAAIVLKQRLADACIDAAGKVSVIPLLPPRIPTCTAETLRQYIANPPDYLKLKDGERFIEAKETEADIERLKMQRAQAETEAANARVAMMDKQQQLASNRQATAANAPQSSDRASATVDAAAAKRTADARQAQVDAARTEADAKLAAAKAKGDRLLAGAQGDHATARDVGKEVASKTEEKKAATATAEQSKPAASAAADNPNAPTRQQCLEVVELCKSLFGAEVKTKLANLLAKAKVAKVSELSRSDCHLLIEKLKAAVANRAVKSGAAAAKSSEPPFDVPPGDNPPGRQPGE